MFRLKHFLLIIISSHLFTCNRFLILTISGWTSSWEKWTGGSSSYLLKSTGNQTEFIGLKAFKLSFQNQSWVLADGEDLFTTAEDNSSLPLGKNTWSNQNSLIVNSTGWTYKALKIKIAEVQFGKNPGYMMEEREDTSFYASTAEECFRQISTYIYSQINSSSTIHLLSIISPKS